MGFGKNATDRLGIERQRIVGFGPFIGLVNNSTNIEYLQLYPLTLRPRHNKVHSYSQRERESNRVRSLRSTACSKLPYTAVCTNPTAAAPKQIDSFPHREGVGCGEEMTNNPRKHNGIKAYAAANVILPLCDYSKGDGDKRHVSTTEQRKRDNGGNVRDGRRITERKHCNKLKA